MDRPLQSIIIAGAEGQESVKTGIKTCTFRYGWRDYKIGPVLLGDNVTNWAILARITFVAHFILKDAPISCLVNNGYSSVETAWADLKTFYPQVDLNSKITYVEWSRS